ncbi:D-alanyl-D-alanine carboxypeptidase [Streptomyces abyssalis]|uniref:D-alanyl-D-alanine carboxypeptidase n=1 Tax=Streptomyces abyssalis TaxID=933944 RepID=A0A1E7JP22_9ACTN|nr:serine hydrolase [Streptomyces abyssalis]OEU86582.1 D-alanyl-D-alanine carboxypeptidase [Streptomyces abyssalis]OEU90031.1 D-alanyl-D-alanine carboxypeptidase [Streptomyces abyssalis]OEV06255.1 D-alanyl-D-alanine carboxypeptidase [Streptomyces nanshensis]
MRVSTRARRIGVAGVAAGAVLAAGPFVYPAQAAGPSGVSAKGAFLLDASSGEEMWGKSSDTKRQMASTTKVMTAAVVVSSGADLDRRVTVKKAYRDYVAKWGGSTADLRTGDKLTLRQLLYGLLLPSGCDAAYALADALGKGSSTTARANSFIAKMNAKADQLGMKNTEFDSFDGISKKGRNYSTARDMAKLGKYALGSTNIRKVAKSTSTKQKATNGRTYTWYNTNQLLGSYQGVIGIKTGTGTKAGPCLVFAAERNGRSIVGVILNSSKRYPDAKKMLDWSLQQKTPKLDLRSLPEGAERD